MQIEKSYFALSEVLARWSIAEEDLIYLAENDELRLSIRVFGLPLEFGDYEVPEGERPFRVPTDQMFFSGVVDLHACDVFHLFRSGEAHLTEFRALHSDYASLWGSVEPLYVVIGDLLMRRDERDRYEIKIGICLWRPDRRPYVHHVTGLFGSALQWAAFPAWANSGSGRAGSASKCAGGAALAKWQDHLVRSALEKPADVGCLQVQGQLA